MSDTPRTDAVFNGTDQYMVDFARELERELAKAERLKLGLAYEVQYIRGEIHRAIDYANGRESEWGERAEGAFAILYAALSVPASQSAN